MDVKTNRKSLSVIYVPGLGDYRVGGQRKVVNTWKWWRVEPHLLQMNWQDDEPWESKLNRLLKLIDKLSSEGKHVGLIGASAGAAAVVNAYAARKDTVVGCVLISGKVNRPDAIGAHYRKRNPAFVTCAYDCEKALATLTPEDRRRILSRYALLDGVVAKVDSNIPGAQNHIVPSVGHAVTIGIQITVGAPGFLLFLKRLAAC